MLFPLAIPIDHAAHTFYTKMKFLLVSHLS